MQLGGRCRPLPALDVQQTQVATDVPLEPNVSAAGEHADGLRIALTSRLDPAFALVQLRQVAHESSLPASVTGASCYCQGSLVPGASLLGLRCTIGEHAEPVHCPADRWGFVELV